MLMKKIFAFLIVLLSAGRLYAMETRELEEIIKNIIDSNAAASARKPATSSNSDAASSAIDSAEGAKETKGRSVSFPSADKALLESGIALFEASLYENSRQKLEELKLKYPDSPNRDIASIWLAKILVESGKPDEAVAMLKTINQESGEYPTALFATGEIFLKKGNDPGAIEYFYRIASQSPDHYLADDSLIAIARIYLKNNRGNQALEAAIKVIKNYEKRETIDDAYFLIAQVFEKDALLKDVGIARKMYKIFIKKADTEKAPFFYNSPLLTRVKNNLSNIENTYYNKAFIN